VVDIEILDVSLIGLNQDVRPHLLSPEAFNSVFNIRFREGQAEWVGAKGQILGTLSDAPYFATMVRAADGTRYVVYFSLTDAFCVDQNLVHTEITRLAGDYSGVKAADFNHTVIGGIPIFNNWVDLPQAWSPVSPLQRLVDLVNFPATERARVLRAFGPYLCAYNISIGGTKYPHMVHWSHPADPGSLPVSWDETDPTKDAGKHELSDVDSGVIVDAKQLRGQMFIYKENSTWVQRIIGGRFVFSWDTFLETTGILGPRCVGITGDGRYHFVATQDDVIIHDGATVTPLLEGRMKRSVFSAIDGTNFANSFVFVKPDTTEMWFCYPTSGNTFPNRALIWNYGVQSERGVLSEAEVDFQGAATVDLDVGDTETWDSDTDVWDSDSTYWDTVSRRKTMVWRPSASKILLLDSGTTNDGAAVTATLQRAGLAIAGQKRNGEWINDYSLIKMIKRVWIRGSGGSCSVRVGYQNTVEGSIEWSASQSFNPETQLYLDFIVTGPVLAIEFSGTTNFAIQGYKMEISPAGRLMPI
jgi:hypothetical protein